MKRASLFLSLFYLLACTVALAQMPGMKVYGESDGFPSTIGYIIDQDSVGFIWIGSNKGVIRYDGHSFKVFDERHGLQDKEIIQAIPTAKNTILIAPLVNNLAYYRNGRIYNELSDTSLAKVNHAQINVLVKDHATGNCWIGDQVSKNDLFLFKEGRLKRVKVFDKQKFSLISAYNDYLFIRNRKQVMLFNYKSGSLENLTIIGDPHFFKTGNLIFNHNHTYVAGYSSLRKKIGVYRIHGHNQLEFIASAPAPEAPKQMIIDRKNRLWFTFRDKGVHFWGAVSVLTPQTEPIPLLPETVVNYVFADRNDNLWFSTQRKGLYFIPASQWINHLSSKKIGLPNRLPLSVCGDGEDHVYICYEGYGALGIIHHSYYYETNPSEPSTESLLGMTYHLDKLYTYRINDIQVFNRHGLFLYGINSNQEKTIGVVKDMSFGNDSSRLYISSNGGLRMYNTSTQSLSFSKFKNRSTCVLPLPNQKNLIGTPSGLYQGNEVETELMPHPVLSRANITDMALLNEETVLIGTGSDGLFMYDPQRKVMSAIKLSEKAYLGTINQIFCENTHTFWLATDQGIFSFQLNRTQAKLLSHHSFTDGLPSNNTSSVWVTPNMIYAATSAGLAIVSRQAIPQAKDARVRVLKATTDDATVFTPQHIDFDYPARNLSLQLSSFSFEHLGQTLYQYMLEGYNSRWFTSRNPIIHFNNLPPGDYTFKVRPISPEGLAGGPVEHISLNIYPAFWQTIWFKLLAGLLITGLLIGGIYFTIFRQQQRSFFRQRQKRKLAELELEAIKAQINPHFIYNCLNSIQFFTYKGDVENARQYLDRFSRLIRQTMQLSREMFTTIEEEMSYLSNYLQLEQMRFKEQLEYHISIQENINPKRIIPAMLLQPYIENALKHGIAHNPEKGKLLISIREKENEWLEVHIHDNGPGFAEQHAENNTGLGLRLSGSRIKTYNQLFQLDLQLDILAPPQAPGYNGKGTLIQILIPVITHENVKV